MRARAAADVAQATRRKKPDIRNIRQGALAAAPGCLGIESRKGLVNRIPAAEEAVDGRMKPLANNIDTRSERAPARLKKRRNRWKSVSRTSAWPM